MLVPSLDWQGVAGEADAGRPVTPDTMFAMASVTKPVLAALTLRLAEQGKLDLDAPIAEYLPDGLDVDTNGATVRHALGHRSGIGEHTVDPDFFEAVTGEPERTWTPEEVVAYAGPPSFEAGSGWEYSNTNYVLVALALAEVTGEPVGTLLRRELLDPAGIDRLVYQPDAPPSEPLAIGHSDMDAGDRGQTISGGDLLPTRAFATAAGGAGGMAADAPSLARLGAGVYGGDLLSADSLEQMLAFEDADGGAYGLGTAKIPLRDGTVAVGHDGLIPGFASALLHVPGEDLTAAVLVNTDNPGSPADPMALARLMLAAARGDAP